MAETARPEYRLMLRDLPQEERPRERLKAHGTTALSNSELVAILLRTGLEGESVLAVANGLLARFGGLPGLARATFGELCTHRGVSEAKACQLLAALELGRRLVSLQPEARPIVRTPQDIANLLLAEMALLDQEHLKTVLLDTRNHVLGVVPIYVGSVNSALVRPAEVFRPAVRENCPAVIAVHNHPSGDPTPSEDDARLTRELVEAGKLLGIELLDHIVLGRQGFVSLRERGLGFGG
jgi:DNA repair protein RadC